ncbi:MAG: biosynthetic-type acetolactate synthase large subunit [Deltaproteobacteria bacterium]|nr:biosynthetic-type acetolactate synthase large subunit [Deltaproteobacteria bacterium]
METTGADIVLRTLEREGVEAIFGYPGANSLPLHDRMIDSPVRHFMMRHEQAAAHAADGYARATGRVGVCLSTSGPGATNLVTGIATAFMDSTPLVALTAQVSTDLLGRDAFQETDIIGITLPITKHSFQVKDINDLGLSLRQAFALARSGRPGPVLVDLPKNILSATGPIRENRFDETPIAALKNQSNGNGLREIAEALNRSKRPVVIIGGGVKWSGADRKVNELIHGAGIPFATTMMGIGSVQAANGLNLGFIGTHGHDLANRIVHQSDFILAVGTRFTDRSTSRLDEFAPLARVAHIDIDPTSIGKNVPVDLPYVGDIAQALTALLPLVRSRNRTGWLQKIRRERTLLEDRLPNGGCGEAGQFIDRLQKVLPEETTVVTDVGLNQIWTVRTWNARAPRSLITNGGMGTMGFGLPAAIGAKIGTPEREVVLIIGDGGFLMNIQELATISYYRLPIKIVVINNGQLGMIRQIQDLFYDARFTTITLGNHTDLVAVARGFGIPAGRVRAGGDTEKEIEAFRKARGPYLLEAAVDPENYVYPIIPPGRSNIDMIYGKCA